MKKLTKFFVFLLGVFLWSCTNSEELTVESGGDGNPDSFAVTQQEAKSALTELLSSLDASTRSGSPRRIAGDKVDLLYRTHPSLTRSGDEPLFYVFNLSNNEGYALVSTDFRTTPVYAVTDSGTYSEENDNPGYQLFMEKVEATYDR